MIHKGLIIAACVSLSGACIGICNVAYAATFKDSWDLFHAGFWMTINAGLGGFWIGVYRNKQFTID